ncbi:hypothetical protein AB996_0871 [Lactococcus cremoris]|uniref:Uncharacterized protein n=1 Tax=Lactococcus lactis subsp. cremoris TaxID=1359 RepID=A0A166JXE7_LACLC|nr:hypothetical protein [Lactococcus cremoris]KZK07179.1 hypothetical protein AB996_0871 [Lactococcus cremoris]
MKKEEIIEQVKALEQKIYKLQESTSDKSFDRAVKELIDGVESKESDYYEIKKLAGMVQLLRVNIELYFDESYQLGG